MNLNVILILLMLANIGNFVKAFRFHSESSVILRSLVSGPSYSFHVEASSVIDTKVVLESFHLIEGDIIPDVNNGQVRSAFFSKEKLWPRGRIPYIISSKLNNHRKEIKDAMQYIENVTCLHFVPRKKEKDYVKIHKGADCSSKVGMARGLQEISLGNGCYHKGVIIHELLHTVGFYHEQSRSDRDYYIYIHWENIIPGREYNFKKRKINEDLLLTPYDYHSIMHYGAYAFSKDRKEGLRTMTPKLEGVVLDEPGQKKELSPSDIIRIAILYNCTLPRYLADFQLYSNSMYSRLQS